MTVLAVVKDSKSIAIATDSQTTSGRHKTYRGPKWVEGQGYLVASTGYSAARPVIKNVLESKLVNSAEQLAGAIMQGLADKNWKPKAHEGGPSSFGNAFIVVDSNNHKIYEVDCTGMISEITHYHADGSGFAYALGALAVAKGGAKKRAIAACAAAIENCIYCSGEIHTKVFKC